ncbi:hypothetical protein B7435_03380 [Mycolicibacterium peregrinum]|uniref:hypothetical protein n=1 Tax=Mycolicibacterium peregrinum TaxID=43304 RepID=UPI0006D7EAC1|nr:hypothetical protein [Mycolicibacterium peregrinum]MCV7203750.1 hypothetical protein [Mycolicibacterium peregrinum]ORW58129.1 hypothetical protein AWC21_15600 [Mycolicibacterium peregrinum]OWM10381.1 hypothetical protein B7435_03380 [Mycolicibacterium peregrinum]
MHVELIGDTTVRMAPGMYSWCALLTFAIPVAVSGTDLIDSVLTHPRYHHDCASPWTGKPDSVHGPYRLDSLNADGFQRCSHADAVATLWSWPATNLNPWVSAEFLLSRELVMAWTAPILSTADEIYRLSVPREGNEHSYGWVVGLSGFHEFIAVCRPRGSATVIIATDD